MLTVCMIVKDEEPIIEESLKAVKKCGYDIVIVDTGSKDRTKEIALKYTDKVYDYAWNNNFSDARNYAIEKAQDDFILMLDADEVIVDFDKINAENKMKLNSYKKGRISIVNEFEQAGIVSKSKEKISRVFSKKYYSYKGSIHEQLVNIDGIKDESYDFPLTILHKGYSNNEVQRKDKINRNLLMLKEELKANDKDPYIIYQIAKTYYMAHDYKNSCVYFEKAMDIDLNTNLEYVQDLIECYGYCLINMKMYSEALKLVNIYDVFAKSSDFIFLVALIYMNNGMFAEAVNEFNKAAQMDNAKITGVNSYLSLYNIGVIYECLGQMDKAREFYSKCSPYEPAENRLKLMNKSC